MSTTKRRRGTIQGSTIERIQASEESWSRIEELSMQIAKEFVKGGIESVVALRRAAELISTGQVEAKS